MRNCWQLIRATDQSILLARLELADTFWSRLRGLQFRPELSRDTGLLLRPCSSLHTCFMRFPIDVVMLDADNVVIAVRRNLRPWRMLICAAGTHGVIETATDVLDVKIGHQLAVTAE